MITEYMDHFNNDELEYIDDYYHYRIVEFISSDDDDDDDDDDDAHEEGGGGGSTLSDDDDDFEPTHSKNDTTALEARNGKDIQGIPWEMLTFTRDNYRQTRLKQYKNFQNFPPPYPQDRYKECHEIDNGANFYDFHFNTRLVRPSIVHFQATICLLFQLLSAGDFYEQQAALRNLLWATSKHDVYLMQNYSLMHWSSLLRRGTEVLNVAKPITSTLKCPGLLSPSTQTLSRVQISTMAVKENLMVAGGFQGELVCKYINQPEIAFCAKVTTDENAITNAVDVFCSPNGAMRVIAANNDAKVRVFDTEHFSCINQFTFDWSVNNISVSPDGKLLAVLGDSDECLLADSHSGKVTGTLKGHLDYSFASAWHPGGHILATGNQDTTCRLWDIRNLSQSMAVLKGRMGAIRAVNFTTDGRFLAIAEPADFVHVFDTGSGYVKCQDIDLFGEIAGISFSPDTEALFVSVADRTYGSLLEFTRRRCHQYLDSLL
ncbi:hypothetical protein ACFE04_025762 [Oxalis oulophora]